MTCFTIEVKQGDRVLHRVENVELPDQQTAWGYVRDLAFHFETPGLRFIVKDETGGVVFMAGSIALQKSPPNKAA